MRERVKELWKIIFNELWIELGALFFLILTMYFLWQYSVALVVGYTSIFLWVFFDAMFFHTFLL